MNTIQNPILPGLRPMPAPCTWARITTLLRLLLNGGPALRFTIPKIWSTGSGPLRPLPGAIWVPSELLGNYNSGSLWAPHLSYADGLFWLVYTDVKSSTAFKDTLNYVVTAPKITGPWSEPTLVTASGFDPALFHDDDGRHYFLNMLFDWRLENPGLCRDCHSGV